VYVFAEGGRLTVLQPLPQQVSQFDLVDYGVGSRTSLMDHFNGSIDLAVPRISQAQSRAHDLRLTFRLWVAY
jgi:hemolysin activation/secretion protein